MFEVPATAQLLFNVANDINSLRAFSCFFVRPIVVAGVMVVKLKTNEPHSYYSGGCLDRYVFMKG